MSEITTSDGDVAVPTPDEVAANRRAWLAALRSGNYPQTRKVLRNATGFCCLGVAEDVLDCEWQAHGYRPGVQVAVHGTDRGRHHICLSGTAQRRLGVLSDNPYVVCWDVVHESWVTTTLAALNDHHRLTLAEIADVVDDQSGDQSGDWVGDHATTATECYRRNAALVRPAPSLPVLRVERDRGRSSP